MIGLDIGRMRRGTARTLCMVSASVELPLSRTGRQRLRRPDL